MAAAMGQLRELVADDLLDQVRYLSTVSGGGWAGSVFTFATPEISDGELLGPYVAPEYLTPDSLDDLPSTRLASGTTARFGLWWIANGLLHAVDSQDVWDLTVTQVFLEGFGIGLHTPPAASLDAIARIKERNPDGSTPTDFHLPRQGRPCLLVHTTLCWPTNVLESENWVQFAMSPLSMGCAAPVTLTCGHDQRSVGGGFMETWAFGCGAPAIAPPFEGHHTDVSVDNAPHWTGVGDVTGMGSCAWGSMVDRVTTAFTEERTVWPIPTGTAHDYSFIDGGTVDNYAMLALLSRDVDRIVVFVNSLTPLGMDPPEELVAEGGIDAVLPSYFGVTSAYPNNTVFPWSEFCDIVAGLQARKAAGEPVVYTSELTTQDNAWWGVEPGKTVRVTWVYLDECAQWRDRLSLAMQQALANGDFPNFPHYATIGEPGGGLLGLSARETNLLAHLAAWTVRTAIEPIRAGLAP